MSIYDYTQATARNIGWLTQPEQTSLRTRHVAIAGLGGVGGLHLLTLARLGIGRFSIADHDHFELANFNRQVGALVSTLGQSKAQVLARMALDINPEIELRVFEGGVTEANLPDFFAGADLYVDGLDFFAFDARESVFRYCTQHAIPAITAAPLGMSAALLTFLPGGMGFEDYFHLSGCTELEKAIRFYVGLAPRALHNAYLVDPGRLDLQAGRGPSTIIGCQLCASLAAAEALKILLGRGRVRAAPEALQFDAYLNRITFTRRPGGNAHPLNRRLIERLRRRLTAAPKRV